MCTIAMHLACLARKAGRHGPRQAAKGLHGRGLRHKHGNLSVHNCVAGLLPCQNGAQITSEEFKVESDKFTMKCNGSKISCDLVETQCLEYKRKSHEIKSARTNVTNSKYRNTNSNLVTRVLNVEFARTNSKKFEESESSAVKNLKKALSRHTPCFSLSAWMADLTLASIQDLHLRLDAHPASLSRSDMPICN